MLFRSMASNSNVNERIAALKQLQRAHTEVVASYARLDAAAQAHFEHVQRASTPIGHAQEAYVKPPEPENIKRSRDAIHALNSELSGMDSILARVSQALGLFFRYAVLYQGLYAMVGAIQGAVKEILDLQNALIQIKAISGATNAEMKKISAAVRDVAEASAFTSTEVAKGGQTLVQAGIPLKEFGATLKATSDLAQSTGASFDQAAEVMTTFFAVFENANPSKIADELRNAVNISKLTMADLSTISNYILESGKAYGLTEKTLLAASATLRDSGIKASTIGTGLRQVINEGLSPDTKALKALEKRYAEMGENLSQSTIKQMYQGFQQAKDPLEALLNELQRIGYNGVGKGTLDRMFEVRAENVLKALLQQRDSFEKNKVLIDENGTAAKGAATQLESFETAVQNLGEKLKGIGYTTAEEGIVNFAASIRSTTDDVGKLADKLTDLKAETGRTGLGQTAGAGILATGAALAGKLSIGKSLLVGGVTTGIELYLHAIGKATAATEMMADAVDKLVKVMTAAAIVKFASGQLTNLGTWAGAKKAAAVEAGGTLMAAYRGTPPPAEVAKVAAEKEAAEKATVEAERVTAAKVSPLAQRMGMSTSAIMAANAARAEAAAAEAAAATAAAAAAAGSAANATTAVATGWKGVGAAALKMLSGPFQIAAILYGIYSWWDYMTNRWAQDAEKAKAQADAFTEKIQTQNKKVEEVRNKRRESIERGNSLSDLRAQVSDSESYNQRFSNPAASEIFSKHAGSSTAVGSKGLQEVEAELGKANIKATQAEVITGIQKANKAIQAAEATRLQYINSISKAESDLATSKGTNKQALAIAQAWEGLDSASKDKARATITTLKQARDLLDTSGKHNVLLDSINGVADAAQAVYREEATEADLISKQIGKRLEEMQAHRKQAKASAIDEKIRKGPYGGPIVNRFLTDVTSEEAMGNYRAANYDIKSQLETAIKDGEVKVVDAIVKQVEEALHKGMADEKDFNLAGLHEAMDRVRENAAANLLKPFESAIKEAEGRPIEKQAPAKTAQELSDRYTEVHKEQPKQFDEEAIRKALADAQQAVLDFANKTKEYAEKHSGDKDFKESMNNRDIYLKSLQDKAKTQEDKLAEVHPETQPIAEKLKTIDNELIPIIARRKDLEDQLANLTEAELKDTVLIAKATSELLDKKGEELDLTRELVEENLKAHGEFRAMPIGEITKLLGSGTDKAKEILRTQKDVADSYEKWLEVTREQAAAPAKREHAIDQVYRDSAAQQMSALERSQLPLMEDLKQARAKLKDAVGAQLQDANKEIALAKEVFEIEQEMAGAQKAQAEKVLKETLTHFAPKVNQGNTVEDLMKVFKDNPQLLAEHASLAEAYKTLREAIDKESDARDHAATEVDNIRRKQLAKDQKHAQADFNKAQSHTASLESKLQTATGHLTQAREHLAEVIRRSEEANEHYVEIKRALSGKQETATDLRGDLKDAAGAGDIKVAKHVQDEAMQMFQAGTLDKRQASGIVDEAQKIITDSLDQEKANAEANVQQAAQSQAELTNAVEAARATQEALKDHLDSLTEAVDNLASAVKSEVSKWGKGTTTKPAEVAKPAKPAEAKKEVEVAKPAEESASPLSSEQAVKDFDAQRSGTHPAPVQEAAPAPVQESVPVPPPAPGAQNDTGLVKVSLETPKQEAKSSFPIPLPVFVVNEKQEQSSEPKASTVAFDATADKAMAHSEFGHHPAVELDDTGHTVNTLAHEGVDKTPVTIPQGVEANKLYPLKEKLTEKDLGVFQDVPKGKLWGSQENMLVSIDKDTKATEDNTGSVKELTAKLSETKKEGEGYSLQKGNALDVGPKQPKQNKFSDGKNAFPEGFDIGASNGPSSLPEGTSRLSYGGMDVPGMIGGQELANSGIFDSSAMIAAIQASNAGNEKEMRAQIANAMRPITELADPSLSGNDWSHANDQQARSTEPDLLKYQGQAPASSRADESPNVPSGYMQFAEGGEVGGVGTETSDSNPAKLSKGEFVEPAKVVGTYGEGFMDKLRNLQIDPATVASLLQPKAEAVDPTRIADTSAFDSTKAIQAFNSQRSGVPVHIHLDRAELATTASQEALDSFNNMVRLQAIKTGRKL